MKRERIYFIDVAKIIAAFLVVYTHLYTSDDPFRLWVYSFHMPLFFVISGIFHKEITIANSLKRNFFRLVIPAFCFILLGLITYVALNGLETAISVIKTSIYGMVSGGRIPANNVIWFLFALFWCNIFLNVILKYRWSLLLVAIAYIVFIYLDLRLFHIKQALFAFPYYVCGYWLNKYKVIECFRERIKSGSTKAVILLMGGAFLLVCYQLSEVNPNASMHLCHPGEFNSYLKYPLFYLNGIIGTLGVLFIAAVLPKVYKTIVERCSYGLISILGLQYLFMMFWDAYVGRNQSYYLSFFAAIAIMALCLSCHTLFEKYFPFMVGKTLNK